jgi:hypothetical protein
MGALRKPCREWEGKLNNDGYGIRKYEGRSTGVHRIAFFEAYGWWPEVVRHKCDNPACYEPSHLMGGNQADNVRDMDDAAPLLGRSTVNPC